MEVEMIDGLAALRSIIDHDAEPRLELLCKKRQLLVAAADTVLYEWKNTLFSH